MSPEHALGAPVGPSTDIFSLGLVAAVAATGRHPYGTGGAVTLAARIANSDLRPPELDGYPPELRPLLDRCLTADPDTRITPAELAELCERSAGRPSDDSDGRLPRPLLAEIERREQAVRRLPRPADPPASPTRPETGTAGTPGAVPGDPPPDSPGGHPPTTQPTAEQPPYGQPPTGQTPHGPPPHGQPTMPGAPPAYAPPQPVAPPATATGGAARTAVRIGAAAGAAVLLVAGTWLVATREDGGRGDSARGRLPDRRPARRLLGVPGARRRTVRRRLRLPRGDRAYEVIFENRPFALRAPAEPHVIGVDLDEPRVGAPGEIDNSGDELELSEVSGGRWTFRTPMGRSTGPGPEECLRGSQSDVLPSEIGDKELRSGRALPVGTRLCTVTSDGNLAMLRITKVEQRPTNDLPDFFTELTLWRKR